MVTLEPAQAGDAELCSQILDEGRQFQRAQGFVQWTDDYPNLDTVRRDVAAGIGYVLRANGAAAGYLCVDFSGEPAYAVIEGAWHVEPPYAVVHRMAFRRSFQGAGLADSAFALVEQLCAKRQVPYIRADTDFPNKRMQHILEKNGFLPCGVIFYQKGGRLAYDKRLS